MLNQRPITLWPTSHLWREFPANKVYHLSPKCLGTDDGTVSHIRLQIISFDELYTSPSKFCSWRPCVCVLKSLCLALQNITFNSTIQHGTCTHVFWSQKNAHKCRLRIKFDVFVYAAREFGQKPTSNSRYCLRYMVPVFDLIMRSHLGTAKRWETVNLCSVCEELRRIYFECVWTHTRSFDCCTLFMSRSANYRNFSSLFSDYLHRLDAEPNVIILVLIPRWWYRSGNISLKRVN